MGVVVVVVLLFIAFFGDVDTLVIGEAPKVRLVASGGGEGTSAMCCVVLCCVVSCVVIVLCQVSVIWYRVICCLVDVWGSLTVVIVMGCVILGVKLG